VNSPSQSHNVATFDENPHVIIPILMKRPLGA
jgi:hypothetical protein